MYYPSIDYRFREDMFRGGRLAANPNNIQKCIGMWTLFHLNTNFGCDLWIRPSSVSAKDVSGLLYLGKFPNGTDALIPVKIPLSYFHSMDQCW